jgi:hypothetical protein
MATIHGPDMATMLGIFSRLHQKGEGFSHFGRQM